MTRFTSSVVWAKKPTSSALKQFSDQSSTCQRLRVEDSSTVSELQEDTLIPIAEYTVRRTAKNCLPPPPTQKIINCRSRNIALLYSLVIWNYETQCFAKVYPNHHVLVQPLEHSDKQWWALDLSNDWNLRYSYQRLSFDQTKTWYKRHLVFSAFVLWLSGKRYVDSFSTWSKVTLGFSGDCKTDSFHHLSAYSTKV